MRGLEPFFPRESVGRFPASGLGIPSDTCDTHPSSIDLVSTTSSHPPPTILPLKTSCTSPRTLGVESLGLCPPEGGTPVMLDGNPGALSVVKFFSLSSKTW